MSDLVFTDEIAKATTGGCIHATVPLARLAPLPSLLRYRVSAYSAARILRFLLLGILKHDSVRKYLLFRRLIRAAEPNPLSHLPSSSHE